MTKDRCAGKGYEQALDGLRGIAVLAVLLFHAEIPGVPGGFLGVELFFVISGYLITSLLLSELEQTGTLSLIGFWARRARRLLPALLLLGVGSLGIAALWAPDALAPTKHNLAAGLLGFINWVFVANDQEYTMSVERPPLLLHLWSLAIEFQFYLVWPLVLFGVWKWLADSPTAPNRRGIGNRRGSVALSLACVFGALLSAADMAWLSSQFDGIARPYYGTDARMSGLLWGAALAACSRRTEQRFIPAALPWRTLLGWATLMFLLWSMGNQASLTRQTFLWGIPSVGPVGALLIWATRSDTTTPKQGQLPTPPAQRQNLNLKWFGSKLSDPLVLGLTRGPLPWVGRLSYSLYLWHWPIFAVTRPAIDCQLAPIPLLCLRLGLSVAAASLSYYLVELPTRRVDWTKHSFRVSRPVARYLALGTVALGAIAGSALGLQTTLRSESTTALALRPSPLPGAAAFPAAHSIVARVGAPSVRDAANKKPELPIYMEALEPGTRKTLTLLSDSVALNLYPWLHRAMPDWQIEILGRPALMVKQAVYEFLKDRHVGSVVVVCLAYNSLFEKDRLHYDRWAAVWDKDADNLIFYLKAYGAKRIIWVTLRESTVDEPTSARQQQAERYAWYFPYVNERLRMLPKRHSQVVLADWHAVSNIPNITKDLIHLNSAGAQLMSETIARTVLGPEATGGPQL